MKLLVRISASSRASLLGLAKDEAERELLRKSDHIKDLRNHCSNGLTELCEANHFILHTWFPYLN